MVGRIIESGALLAPVTAVQTAPDTDPAPEVKKVAHVSKYTPKNPKFFGYTPEVSALMSGSGARLRVVREAAGLSRPALAAGLSCPTNTLKNYELGYRAVGPEVLLSIRRFFGTDAIMLFILTGVLTECGDIAPAQDTKVAKFTGSLKPVFECIRSSKHA